MKRNMNILVTGAAGFVGRNIVANLRNLRDGKNRARPLLSIGEIFEYDRSGTQDQLDAWCARADFVFHFAGVNRPENPARFQTENVSFTSRLLRWSGLRNQRRRFEQKQFVESLR